MRHETIVASIRGKLVSGLKGHSMVNARLNVEALMHIPHRSIRALRRVWPGRRIARTSEKR